MMILRLVALALLLPSSQDRAAPLEALDAAELWSTLSDTLQADDLIAEHTITEHTRASLGQGHEGEGLVIGRFVVNATRSVDGDQALSIKGRSVYPYEFALEWEEEIDQAQVGRRDGGDTFRGRSGPLSPARLGRREKERLLSSPAMLLRGAVPTSAKASERGATLEATWPGGEVTLQVDLERSLIEAACFLEDLPPQGDVEVCWEYSDWRGTPPAPWRITQRVGDVVVAEAERQTVERVEGLAVSMSANTPDPTTSAFGWARTTWLSEWMNYGFPQDESGVTLSLATKRVAKGVTLVLGPFHNSLVVDLGAEELFVVEAPYSPEQADALFELIAGRWPGYSIRGVALTHSHDDHAGGVRAVAERGLPLYVHAADEARVQRWLPGETTVRPRPAVQSFALNTVDSEVAISGEERSVVLAPLSSAHVSALLLASVPEERVVHVADLINPGLFPTRGLRGALLRRVLNRVAPFNLAKAGVYAASFQTALDELGLSPRRVTGGHGPLIGRPHDLRVLERYADPEALSAWLDETSWPPPSD